jgi:hypothetical protein
MQDAFDLRGTSRQRNTHSTESREVHYPWHPWHDRVVAIHQSFTRNGCALFRCSIEENQWMFDPSTCCGMRLTTVPTVSSQALLDLKPLLQCALPGSDVVLQALHRSLLFPGGADARVTEPTKIRSSRPRHRVPL